MTGLFPGLFLRVAILSGTPPRYALTASVPILPRFLLVHTDSIPICSPFSSDMRDTVPHKNVGLSDVIVSDNLDLDQLPIFFHALDHVRARDVLN